MGPPIIICSYRSLMGIGYDEYVGSMESMLSVLTELIHKRVKTSICKLAAIYIY